MRAIVISAVLVLMFMVVPTAQAQFNSGSDGSDGAFSPSSDITVDLSQAPTAAWNTPSPQPGKGVYDPEKWAVVFKYSTVTIPAGVTVTFTNHPARAPVIWLTTGDVTIDGTVSLAGQDGLAWVPPFLSEPGPGGFRGGSPGLPSTGREPAPGFGPGGANVDGPDNGGYGSGIAGSYATQPPIPWYWCLADSTSLGPVYGNPDILPLVGGSGASGAWANEYGGEGLGGGAGGGSIMIGSSTRVVVNNVGANSITAAGGNSPAPGWYCGVGGSGGAIRLIASEVSGPGGLWAKGGEDCNGCPRGGDGRIKVEAFTIRLTGSVAPAYSNSLPNPVFPPSNAPVLRATMVKDQPVPADPRAKLDGLAPNGADVTIADSNTVTIQIAASNIPPGTTVNVRVVPTSGESFTVVSTSLTGTLESSTATAQVTFPRGFCAVQLRANWTP